LRRVNTAGVARFKGRYYDAGRRVTCFPASVFDALIEAELLALAAPDRTGPRCTGSCLSAMGTPDSRCEFRRPAPKVE